MSNGNQHWAWTALSNVSAAAILIVGITYTVGMIFVSAELADAGIPRSAALEGVSLDYLLIRGFGAITTRESLGGIIGLSLATPLLLQIFRSMPIEPTKSGTPRSNKVKAGWSRFLVLITAVMIIYFVAVAIVAGVELSFAFLVGIVLFTVSQFVMRKQLGYSRKAGLAAGVPIYFLAIAMTFVYVSPPPLPGVEVTLRNPDATETGKYLSDDIGGVSIVQDGQIIMYPESRVSSVTIE